MSTPQANAALALQLQALARLSQGGDGQPMAPAWQLALEASFGSLAQWRSAWLAMAQARRSGAGWLLLVFEPREGTLRHVWVNDQADAQATGQHTLPHANPACHHTTDQLQALAGAVPLLAFEVRAQADPLAANADAAQVDVLAHGLAKTDWAGVYARYQEAVQTASDPLAAAIEDTEGMRVLDVRRAGAYAQAQTVLPGAHWLDPTRLALWAPEVPRTQALLVYCVHGHEVSRVVALRLRAAGLNVHFLHGGISAWQAAGRPLAVKPVA